MTPNHLLKIESCTLDNMYQLAQMTIGVIDEDDEEDIFDDDSGDVDETE